MPVNEFVPYATDPGANVQAQGPYVADPQTSNGQQTGIADSANANKAWRQGTFMAAVIGQVIVEQLAEDCDDNGDLVDKVTQFVQSIVAIIAAAGFALLNSPAFVGTPTAPTVAGTTDNTTKIATTGFVQAVRALLAPLASPTFTGVPSGPTASFATNTTQFATTAFVQAALVLTRSYHSGQQSIAFPGTVGPLTHSMGGIPKVLMPWLICISADDGYLVGDIVQCPIFGSYSGENRGIRWLISATSISARVGGDPIILPNASTGTPAAIDPTKWMVYVDAYL